MNHTLSFSSELTGMAGMGYSHGPNFSFNFLTMPKCIGFLLYVSAD